MIVLQTLLDHDQVMGGYGRLLELVATVFLQLVIDLQDLLDLLLGFALLNLQAIFVDLLELLEILAHIVLEPVALAPGLSLTGNSLLKFD